VSEGGRRAPVLTDIRHFGNCEWVPGKAVRGIVLSSIAEYLCARKHFVNEGLIDNGLSSVGYAARCKAVRHATLPEM